MSLPSTPDPTSDPGVSGLPAGMGFRESGFSLVAAVFLVVVLASLGTLMVTMSAVQQKTTQFALQAARAERAVRSGVEWALYQVLDPAGNVAATCGAAPATPATNTLGLTAPGLNGFTVDVTCRYTQHQQGPDNFRVFAIDATARATGLWQGILAQAPDLGHDPDRVAALHACIRRATEAGGAYPVS